MLEGVYCTNCINLLSQMSWQAVCSTLHAPARKYYKCSFTIRPVHRVPMPLLIQSQQESNQALTEIFFHYKFLASWVIVELARVGELYRRGCILFCHTYAIICATIQVPPCQCQYYTSTTKYSDRQQPQNLIVLNTKPKLMPTRENLS